MEFFGVLVSICTKWFKSSALEKHRKTGFILTLMLSVYWIVFFILNEQYWLSFHSVTTFSMAVRGVFNNNKKQKEE